MFGCDFMCDLEFLCNPVAGFLRITLHCSFDLRVDALGVTLLAFHLHWLYCCVEIFRFLFVFVVISCVAPCVCFRGRVGLRFS